MKLNFKYVLPIFAIILFLTLTVFSVFSKESKTEIIDANKTANPDYQKGDQYTNQEASSTVLGENNTNVNSVKPNERSSLDQVLGLPSDANMQIVKEVDGYIRAEGIINNNKYVGIIAPFNGQDYKVYFGDNNPRCSEVLSYKVPKEIYLECVEDASGLY